jgi:exodeoxyribonuclease VII large subunit
MQAPGSLELPLADQREVLTVSRLNREARRMIEGGLGTIWVEGEISNLSRPSSGHLYWTLKDSEAQVRCAMFRQLNRQARVPLENGQHVLMRARASVYETRGEFQLIVEYVEPAGEGLLRQKFEALKARLQAEGLFEEARKRPLPRFPERIGVVTSPSGAAVRDVITVLRRRYPGAAVLIYPTAVQGIGAAEEIARTIALADARTDCDVLIVARGGGSLEDLWAFNEEIVARAISATRLPVIVGVGHQTDFTIADFVADVRAPTPSQAAELATPDRQAWRTHLDRLASTLARLARTRLDVLDRALHHASHRLARSHPGVRLQQLSQRLDDLDGRLGRALHDRLKARQARLTQLEAAVVAASPLRRLAALTLRAHLAADRLRHGLLRHQQRWQGRLATAARALQSLSPLATLERGYAIVSDPRTGAALTSSAQSQAGDRLHIRLARGGLEATVNRSDSPTADRDGPRRPDSRADG